MKAFTLYRLYDGDDEIEELGWHFCKTYAEWAKTLYPKPLYEVEVREVPVVIDTERNAFFLYSYDGEYMSRQELVGLIGEEKVKHYEDLKFDLNHGRPLDHCEIDKHYDGGESDGNTYGVEMLHIGMDDIGVEEKIKPIAFIAKAPNLWSHKGASYNGYVAVPPSHQLYRKDYYDECVNNLDVHGGITWARCATEENNQGVRVRIGMVEEGEPVSGNMEDIGDDWWVLGFDTMHSGDNAIRWCRDAVAEETLRLLEQINKIGDDKNDTITRTEKEGAETDQRD